MASIAALTLLASYAAAASYPLAKDWSGSNFFNDWIYNNTYDSLTNGDVVYYNYTAASQNHMAYFAGNEAVVSVDNTSFVVYNDKRGSIYASKMTSTSQYGIGSVIVGDFTHLPFGCSVWPAFWTQGVNWPADGEMDIVEGVNLQKTNTYALHTSANSGCVASAAYAQSGSIDGGQTDCSTTTTQTSGCVVADASQNSYGAAFASSGGGVFAAELTATGVYMWFFPRAQIPSDLASNATTINTANWGTPAANYSNAGTCNMEKEFGFQSIILDITLCGDFAGVPSIYNATCEATHPGLCYQANVINNSTSLGDAYFEINYIRAYSTNVTHDAVTASTGTNAVGTTGTSNTTSSTGAAASNGVQAASAPGASTTAKSSASSVGAFLPFVALVAAAGISAIYL